MCDTGQVLGLHINSVRLPENSQRLEFPLSICTLLKSELTSITPHPFIQKRVPMHLAECSQLLHVPFTAPMAAPLLPTIKT